MLVNILEKWIQRLISALILVASIGCNYNFTYFSSGGGSDSQNGTLSVPPEVQSKLSYSMVYQKVLLQNCVSCHGSSGGVNLQSYQGTLHAAEKIRQSVFFKGTMPKNGSLSEEQKKILWSWIAVGTPELPADGSGNLPLPAPLEPKFASIDQNIFQIKCISCHSAGHSGHRVPLTKEGLLNSPLELVIPGDPDDSGLTITVERTDEKRMPPAKEGYSSLSDTEKQAIRDWIKNGASD